MSGYEDKYVVSKRNGQPINPFAQYFVLRMDTDPHAREAIRTYAGCVEECDKGMANSLLKRLRDSEDSFNAHMAEQARLAKTGQRGSDG